MEQEDKKLLLLDAFALIYRGYFAFSRNPIINSKGVDTSAIYGFTNTMVELIRKEKPSHIAVCFDLPSATTRHETFEGYKANREAMPDTIRESIPVIKEIIDAFNIPIYAAEGYEADDVIGTLAKQAEKEGFQTYMVTPDKDFGQLVSDNIFLFRPNYNGPGFNKMGVQEVLEKWGGISHPLLVIDILAMMGDAVDNIPGIPGVGEKTAIKLLKEFGSLEEVLKNTDQLKGKLKEKVENNMDQALMCKLLATIIIDSPVTFDHQLTALRKVDSEKITSLFSDLEFRTLGQRVLGSDFKINNIKEVAKPQTSGQIDLFGAPVEAPTSDLFEETEEVETVTLKTIDDFKVDYQICQSTAEINQLINHLKKADSYCFDSETTGVDANNCLLVGMSFSVKKHTSFYVPTPFDDEIKTKEILALFAPIFTDEAKEIIGQNLKYDIEVLKWYNVEIKNKIFDTMLAHYLIEPELRHNMDILSENLLNYSPISIETLIGKKGKGQLSMSDIEVEKVYKYACEDADITLQLKEVLTLELENRNAKKLFEEVECPLIPVLVDMETEGVKIDEDALEAYSKVLENDIQISEKKIYELAGMEFNIASPKQLGEVLFDHLGIEYKGKKTKTGQYSTNEETLIKLKGEHEIAAEITEFRQMNKLKSTYVDALPKLINPKSGRVHSSFNQTVVATGRLSSTNPNLQNIPIRTDKGKEVRKAFIPRSKDYTLLAADYSQIELRLVAEVSQDKNMMEAFKSGLDIHTATAAKVYKVPLEEVNADMRRNAKQVNFGIIYGISIFGLAQRMNIKRAEAKELIENYFETYPRIKAFMDESIDFAKEHGYVETILGRRRYLRDINAANATVRGFAERNAINAPIQGSAADLIKVAMINIQKELKSNNLQSKMVLQVHDELIFDTFVPELEQLKEIIERNMTNAIKTEVPLVVDMGTGNNWLEAH